MKHVALLATLSFCTLSQAQVDHAFRAYQAQMAAAEKSLRLGETRELGRWLDATDPSLRGWEWDYLHCVSDASVRRVKTPDTPIRIEMSPTGDTIATLQGNTVHLMTWPDLVETAVIEGHSDAVYRASFNSDGTQLITVSRDVTSRTWDVATGKEIARLELANPAFAACALNPAGDLAATCAWERDEENNVHGVVWLWNPRTGESLQRKRVGIKPLSAIQFTPDGERLVVGSWHGLVHVLDLAGNETRRLTLPDDGIYNAVNDIAVSPDGALVAAASKDRTTRVFALDTGDLVATLHGHGGYVEGVSFSNDGAQLATCSVDATIALWSTESWSRTRVLRGPAETVRGAAWSSDDASIIGCALDGQLWVWDSTTDDRVSTEIHVDAEGIYSTSMSPDGRVVAVACYNGWVRLMDSHTGEEVRAWEAHPGSTCHAAAFSADGRRLITTSWDHTARVWDPSDGSSIAVLDAGDGLYSTAISPEGTCAATSGSTLQIWDVDNAQPMHTIAIDDAEPTRVEFSPDGHLVASGWTDGKARVHSTKDGTLVAALEAGSTRVETVAFLPDAQRLATGNSSGVVSVFGVRGGGASFTIDTGGRGINHIACAGNRIAAATDQLWLIDSEHGGIVLGLAPHPDTLWHLSWSPDGKRLATCAIAGIQILGR